MTTNFSEQDLIWMRRAFELAERAAQQQEVPVGAIIVRDNEVIGEGYNVPISSCDPSAHAEIVAMRDAASRINNYRLINTTLYVTLEPCVMCAGAMVHARIQRLIFGAPDHKAGAIMSVENVLDKPFFNHRVQYAGGLMSHECGRILSEFFQARR